MSVRIIAGHPVPYSLTVQGARSRRAAREAAEAYLARAMPGAILIDEDGDYYWYATPDMVDQLRAEGRVDSLLPIDVGFDLRLHALKIEVRPETQLLRYLTRRGEQRWAGTRISSCQEYMLAQLRRAGYRVVAAVGA